MELSFGQRYDEGFIQPWFTHGALDEIKAMDLSDKIVLTFGAGLGDSWLAKRCKYLYVVERNEEWFNKGVEICKSNCITNIDYHLRPCNDCSGNEDYYANVMFSIKPDIIINDDAYRFEVIEKSLILSLTKPLILITDNWMQDFVFYCPKGEALLKDIEQKIFPQLDHTDHQGHCWKTAIHYLK